VPVEYNFLGDGAKEAGLELPEMKVMIMSVVIISLKKKVEPSIIRLSEKP